MRNLSRQAGFNTRLYQVLNSAAWHIAKMYQARGEKPRPELWTGRPVRRAPPSNASYKGQRPHPGTEEAGEQSGQTLVGGLPGLGVASAFIRPSQAGKRWPDLRWWDAAFGESRGKDPGV